MVESASGLFFTGKCEKQNRNKKKKKQCSRQRESGSWRGRAFFSFSPKSCNMRGAIR